MFSLCHRDDSNLPLRRGVEVVVDLQSKNGKGAPCSPRLKGIQRTVTSKQWIEKGESVQLTRGMEEKARKGRNVSLEMARNAQGEKITQRKYSEKQKQELKDVHHISQTLKPQIFAFNSPTPNYSTTMHTPHKLLSARSNKLICEFQQNFTSIQHEYSPESLLTPMTISLKHQEPELKSNPQLIYSNLMHKTKKIIPNHLPKPYNLRSSIETYRSKSQMIGDNPLSPLTTQMPAIPSQERNALNNRVLTTKRQLEDAKSIISREDESANRLDEVRLEESILLNREIDMFQCITPITGITQCEMVSAVSSKDQSSVTLKVFRGEGDQPFRELESIRRIQRLKSEYPELKTLHFRQLFMEQTSFQKKYIFIFQPFHKTMTQHLQLLSLKSPQGMVFKRLFQREVLSKNELELVQELRLQDFVVTDNDCKFHNYAKIGPMKGCIPTLEVFWKEYDSYTTNF